MIFKVILIFLRFHLLTFDNWQTESDEVRIIYKENWKKTFLSFSRLKSLQLKISSTSKKKDYDSKKHKNVFFFSERNWKEVEK